MRRLTHTSAAVPAACLGFRASAASPQDAAVVERLAERVQALEDRFRRREAFTDIPARE